MANFVNIIYEKKFIKGKPLISADFRIQGGKFKRFLVKFDSGADVTTFGEDIADMLGLSSVESQNQEEVSLADGTRKIVFVHTLFFKIGDLQEIPLKTYFIPEVRGKRLLGRKDFLRKYGVILDTQKIYLFTN